MNTKQIEDLYQQDDTAAIIFSDLFPSIPTKILHNQITILFDAYKNEVLAEESRPHDIDELTAYITQFLAVLENDLSDQQLFTDLQNFFTNYSKNELYKFLHRIFLSYLESLDYNQPQPQLKQIVSSMYFITDIVEPVSK
jgi:hypothetical protein